ncbi:zinc ribbon domain-containing protein [Parasporobacterium paucivorans]|uniref:Zinc-ribbon domain-containing protein n=1 Tax=Parasporobacterium paucivorans DSM 15970 TaxID=1122934 RepID=A0A1M6LE28_9FIRM|nr:zinc ribbon domain-containing protein [Parasporobacterium paucivorans]SHJ69491.1 zinc-ribbon domain-containing protein [Parasporobacterium paucivorans DSM 15970]
MDLFEKLGEMAKSVGDKANETIELGKLNAKINDEKLKMNVNFQKIGKYYYDRYKAGERMDGNVQSYCEDLDAASKKIDELKKELDNIKNKTDAAKAARAAEDIPESASESIVCENCGHLNKPGTNFCGNCGTKLK